MSTATVTPQPTSDPFASIAQPVQSQPAQGSDPFASIAKPIGASSGSQSSPTDAQKAYRQATASGPFAPAGAAEKAMGEQMGDNTAQAKQALSSTLSAAGETAAGITGASVAPELAGTAESFLQISEKALEHLGENYPQLTKLAGKLGYGVGAAGAYKLLNKLGIH